MNLANIFQATQRIETALAAQTKAETDLAAALARITDLEGQLATQPADQSAEVTRLAGELATAQESAATEKARADKAEADLKAEQESLPQKINAEAARIIASNGFSAPVDTIQGKADEAAKPGAGLTGLAKAIAIHKAEKSKK